MSTNVDKIVTEALTLSPRARAFVAEKLIESLDAEKGPDLSSEWRDELNKRCEEIDKGEVELRNAEDVFKKAYASLK